MKNILTSLIISTAFVFIACDSNSNNTTNDLNNTNKQNNTSNKDIFKPSFLDYTTDIKIDEGKKFIGSFKANDNSNITYSIDNDNFYIDLDANLYFKTTPTFNQNSSNIYEVTIKAQDSSSNTSTLKLNIEVLDISTVDESAPVFAKSVDTIYIDQGGYIVDSFIATDNSDVTYHIEGSDKFKIDSDALLSFKDRHFYDDTNQENNTFTLKIVATDSSNNISKMDLTIIIKKPSDIHTNIDQASHNQGRACLDCHGSSLGVAGTIYAKSNSRADVKFFYIRVVKTNGDTSLVKAVQGYGNFANKTPLPSGDFKIEVLNANDQVVNSTNGFTNNSSRNNCNSCHTSNGTNGAPGRILSSQI